MSNTDLAQRPGTAPAKAASSPALLGTYSIFPVRPVSGRGSWLIDADGNEWLDAYGGHAVSATGHSHPAVVQAIRDQAEKLLFYSTAVAHENRERLAEALVRRAPKPLTRVFFCNSGAEANENALNLARKFTGRRAVVSLEGGWHGRTAACLAVTDGAKYEEGATRAGIALSRKIPFNVLEGLERAINPTVAAVILEPVQGMSGARAVDPVFLRRIRELCTEHGVMLIFDEVQCGVGRCGGFTAAEAYGVTPDLLSLAKGLASGLPIGATLISEAIGATVKSGDLGSTFGGGPVPCAAGLATLEVIDREGLIANASRVGSHIAAVARTIPGVTGIEGRGLLLGLRLDRPAAQVQQALIGKRILAGTATDPSILRLIPPLSFSQGEADRLLAALREVLT
ncbi:MAG TPA: aminotransferase class III-fold pyridoxal phosphate-dependent enzyme [Gemmatimonadales bacterium]|nr:aminotransferase class III-fold pyridoxal phosphate-dependent enzyme [Gemmatimonadales bacterium]